MKLAEMFMCVDCECCFKAEGEPACPDCGSKAVTPMSNWVRSMVRLKRSAPKKPEVDYTVGRINRLIAVSGVVALMIFIIMVYIN